jgi:hypothetical protein
MNVVEKFLGHSYFPGWSYHSLVVFVVHTTFGGILFLVIQLKLNELDPNALAQLFIEFLCAYFLLYMYTQY